MPAPRRPRPPKNLRAARRQRGENDGIAGMTSYLAFPFVQALVAITLIWLVRIEVLSRAPAMILGVVCGVALIPVVLIVFQRKIAELLNGPMIARPGCLAGLVAYPICVALSLAVFWYSRSLTVFVIVFLTVPLICFAVALVVTRRTPARHRR